MERRLLRNRDRGDVFFLGAFCRKWGNIVGSKGTQAGPARFASSGSHNPMQG